MRKRTPSLAWYDAADAWFKLLGAIALGYLILAQVVALLRLFSHVSIVLASAVLLAYLVSPAVAWLCRRIPRWASITVVYGLLAAALAVALLYLIPVATNQLHALVRNLPAMQGTIDAVLHDPHNAIVSRLPDPVRSIVQELPDQFAAEVESATWFSGERAFHALFTAAVGVGIAIAIPVVSIYLLAEAATIKRFFMRLIPARHRGRALAMLDEADAVIGGFVRGQLLVALVVAVLAIAALSVLGIPYAYVIGAWAGIADIVPYVGPFAGALPAVIIAVVDKGLGSFVGVVVAFVVINQLEGHVLGPRIVGRTVKLSSLAVIFSLLISARIFGFFGLIVAVPLAGLVRIILLHLVPASSERRELRLPPR